MIHSPHPPAWGREAKLSEAPYGPGAAPAARSLMMRRWAVRLEVLAPTLFLGIALTACGSADSSPSRAPSAQATAAPGQAYRSCLAAHGLPAKSTGRSSPSPGAAPSSARAKAARAACRSLRSRSARRAYRSCLAAHGLPAKPTGTSSPLPGAAPSSGRAKAARAACRSLRPKRAGEPSPSPTTSP